MVDEVHKTFVGSFIGYLKKQLEVQTFTPDVNESIEVAMQCLQAAFNLEESSEEQAAATSSGTDATSSSVDPKSIDIFELYQSVYVERNPKQLEIAESIKNEGNRLMKDGKYNEALLQYDRAILIDPKNPIFYCNRAAAHIRLGDHERAVTDCKSALIYNASYGKAYGRLGIAYSNLGKYAEAQQAYKKAIELEPENMDYRNNLEVARTAQEQAARNVNLGNMPGLSEGLNMMLNNPGVRAMFNSADIDPQQLQQLSQDPNVWNSIAQMLGQFQNGGAGQGPDLMQMFQAVATQLNIPMPPNAPGNGGNNEGGSNTPQQPPPGTS